MKTSTNKPHPPANRREFLLLTILHDVLPCWLLLFLVWGCRSRRFYRAVKYITSHSRLAYRIIFLHSKPIRKRKRCHIHNHDGQLAVAAVHARQILLDDHTPVAVDVVRLVKVKVAAEAEAVEEHARCLPLTRHNSLTKTRLK